MYVLALLKNVHLNHQHIRLLFLLTSLMWIDVDRVVLSWSFLEVTTSFRFNDSIQAYAAGAVEAAVTSQVRLKDPVKSGSTIRFYCTAIDPSLCVFRFQLMYKHWVNTLMGYCGPKTFESGYCQRLKAYITTNLEWVMEQIQEQGNTPYWHQVILPLLK